MNTSQSKPAASKKTSTKSTSPAITNLDTEMPLSEKDEVKKAEQKTNNAVKRST